MLQNYNGFEVVVLNFIFGFCQEWDEALIDHFMFLNQRKKFSIEREALQFFRLPHLLNIKFWPF